MLRGTTLLLAVLTMLTLGGCSGEPAGPSPGDAGPAGTSPSTAVDRDDLVAGLARLYAGDHAQPSDREKGRCFARALLDRAGVEDLRGSGVVDGSRVVRQLPLLEPGLAEHWVAAQFECVDYVEESTRAQEAQSLGAIDAAAYARCLRDAISTAQVKEAITATLTGAWDAPAVRRLSSAQAGCAEQGS